MFNSRIVIFLSNQKTFIQFCIDHLIRGTTIWEIKHIFMNVTCHMFSDDVFIWHVQLVKLNEVVLQIQYLFDDIQSV